MFSQNTTKFLLFKDLIEYILNAWVWFYNQNNLKCLRYPNSTGKDYLVWRCSNEEISKHDHHDSSGDEVDQELKPDQFVHLLSDGVQVSMDSTQNVKLLKKCKQCRHTNSIWCEATIEYHNI